MLTNITDFAFLSSPIYGTEEALFKDKHGSFRMWIGAFVCIVALYSMPDGLFRGGGVALAVLLQTFVEELHIVCHILFVCEGACEGSSLVVESYVEGLRKLAELML